MKVSLVVASGAHEGKVIPLTGAQFLIGRDPQCHLRPASPAISKVHCAVLIRDGKVSVKDFGSTNGTMVGGELVQNKEVPVADGTTLQVGPLDFKMRIEKAPVKADGTPLPGGAEEAAALAAVKAAVAPKTPARDTTPAPAKSGVVAPPAPKSAPPVAPSKPAAAKEAPKPAPKRAPAASGDETEDDRMAAMLLGMDDDGNGSVPDGSTVMDMPAALAGAIETPTGETKVEKKEEGPKKAQTREEMSSAANDILRMYNKKKEAPKKK